MLELPGKISAAGSVCILLGLIRNKKRRRWNCRTKEHQHYKCGGINIWHVHEPKGDQFRENKFDKVDMRNVQMWREFL